MEHRAERVEQHGLGSELRGAPRPPPGGRVLGGVHEGQVVSVGDEGQRHLVVSTRKGGTLHPGRRPGVAVRSIEWVYARRENEYENSGACRLGLRARRIIEEAHWSGELRLVDATGDNRDVVASDPLRQLVG